MFVTISTEIDGITYGPLAITETGTVHRTGLVRVEMLDGSNPTVECYLTKRKTWTVELFPRDIHVKRLIITE